MFLYALIIFMFFYLQMNIVSALHTGNVSKTAIMNERIFNRKVKFYLFTKLNPFREQRITCDSEKDEQDEDSVEHSHFDNEHPTRMIIHGWNGDYEQEAVTKITEAWLSRGAYNIIAVDWPQACSLSYSKAVCAVPEVGLEVATMITCLRRKYRMPMDTLHVIGYSLGAHVAGYAGKNINGRQIHTIIGLDPAKPLYYFDQPKKRLSDTDAQYVEVVHTNAILFGFREPIGTSDFYVNGGMWQPNCGILLSSICSHDRAVTYYAEAITLRNYGSIKCRDYKKAIDKDCGRTFSKVRIGSSKNLARAKGPYYVPIHSYSPYGMKKFE